MAAMKLELEIHTDDERTRELCSRYWQLADGKTFAFKLSELSREYKLTAAAIRKLVNDSSTAFSAKFSCVQCGAPRPFKSRTDYTENSRYYSWHSWVCDTCVEIEREEQARLREQEEQRRYDLVNDEYQSKRGEGLTVTELSFADAIYLLSVIRTGGSEDLTYIVPHEYYEIPLSPCHDYDLEILRQLYYSGALCIHPQSRKDTIEFVDDSPSSFRFYPLRVHWVLPLPDEQKPAQIVQELETVLSSKEWPDAWAAEVNDLRTRVALEESLQYLRYVMGEHGFDFTAGEKTRHVVRSLLNTFSVAQIYNFSWRAAKDAAAFYMRKDVSKQHAANTVPGSIQRMSERAIAEGWEVKPYGRNFKVPQSMVSQVLYNTTLRIGDAGFDQPVPDE